jgi:hypothetical protein
VGNTALHHAFYSVFPVNIDLIRVLLELDPEGVKVKDNEGKTALHHAFYSNCPVKIDLIRVLLELDPEGVKVKNNDGETALHCAFHSDCPYEVVKLIYDAFPYGLNEEEEGEVVNDPFRYASESMLTIFARETFVKKNGYLSYRIANAMGGKDDEEVIDAGGVSALVGLLKEKAVREHYDAMYCVTDDLIELSIGKKGNQACVDAHVPFVLVPLIQDKVLIEKGGLEITHAVYTLRNIASTKNGAFECTKAGAPKALIALMSLKKDDYEIVEVTADAIFNIYAISKSGRKACLDEGVVLSCTQLLKEEGVNMAVSKHYDPLESITDLVRKIAWHSGFEPFIEAGTHAVLISLLRDKRVMEISSAVNNIARALRNITEGEGIDSFIDADGPAVLVSLAQEKSVKENHHAAESVVGALCQVTEGQDYPDITAVIDAGAISVITNLLGEKAVMNSVDAIESISYNLEELVKYEEGRKACVAEGTPSVLIALLPQKSIDAVCVIADILWEISKCEEGRQLCIVSGAALALTDIIREETDTHTAINVARTLRTLAMSEAGKQACVDANAPSALAILAKDESIMKDNEDAEIINGALRVFNGNQLLPRSSYRL